MIHHREAYKISNWKPYFSFATIIELITFLAVDDLYRLSQGLFALRNYTLQLAHQAGSGAASGY